VRCLTLLTVSLTVSLALTACLEEQRYVVENESVAITAQTPVAYVDDDDNPFYVVERTFTLPISEPSASSLDSLARESQGMGLPFPRLPWVRRNHIELQLDYTIANLDDSELVAGIRLDGINEFHAYTPGIEDFHQWERFVSLGPRQRVSGTITELEMDEVATDLATVVNGAPNSNQVVHFLSQSGRDARSKQYIPKVVPHLVGMRLGLVTGQAGNVVLEVSVRAQDHGDRVADRGDRRWQLPVPMDFVPVVPVEEP
jgi:hypothetical protein